MFLPVSNCLRRSLLPFAILLGFATAAPAHAATYYMATPANGGSDSNGCTSSARCATFAHAVGFMHGGDTLIVGDGVYNERLKNPPNGTSGAYTTVKAEHDFGATFHVTGDWRSALDLYQSEYILIQGIKFQGDPTAVGSMPVGLGFTNHIKLIRIAAWDSSCTDNTSAIGVTGDYTLLEDVHVWGCARYKVLIFQSNHTVLRRVVSRYDFHVCEPDWGRQSSPFTSYDSDNSVFENVIAIDSGINANGNQVCDSLFGGIWWENHGDTTFNGIVERTGAVYGSIFLNNYSMNNAPNSPGPNPVGIQSRYKLSGNTTTHTERNNVYWDTLSGGSYGVSVDAGNAEHPTLDLQHNTQGRATGNYYAGNGFTLGVGIGNMCNAPGMGCPSTYASNTFMNSLVMSNQSYGNVGEPGDYNNYWNNGSGGNSHYLAISPGAHDRAVNPGLLYLPRIEGNSPLHGAASDGGDIGANILTKYGVDGTLWGEPGFDTLTTNPLWPYPFEDVIKQDMSSYNCAPTCTAGNYPNAVRGFVLPDSNTSAPGRLYGGSRTLTSYIWEYLGNPCPGNICNYGQQPPSPCDINADGLVNVTDVQVEVNMVLGLAPCINPSGQCTATQLQRVVNSALGGACVSP